MGKVSFAVMKPQRIIIWFCSFLFAIFAILHTAFLFWFNPTALIALFLAAPAEKKLKKTHDTVPAQHQTVWRDKVSN